MSLAPLRPSEDIEIRADAGGTGVILRGALAVEDLARFQARLSAVANGTPLTFDLTEATRIDTAIAWAIAVRRKRIADEGGEVEVIGCSDPIAQLLETVTDALPEPVATPDRKTGPVAILEATGRRVSAGLAAFAEMTGVLGIFLARLFASAVRPRSFRLTALVHHCEAAGFQAVPIVALMAFLIGVVLAFQGSVQLRQFGAEVFVVDLIAISILRELGILLTAIIVAGRTASSYTAAIGSMKMREEIDAMRTLGIDPAAALIVPRVLALVLMLPILGLIANAAGLFGGALMSWVELGISPAMFRTRLVEGTDVSHVFVGLVKAPVFAVVIGVIGCNAGLRVKGNAESLGRMTSSAVVAAIFAVIVIDAVFSIFFAQIGV